MNVRESPIEEKLKKESEENEKSKKELVALNKKLCQKQNEILKLKTDFQKMKRRNGILEEENILRKRPEDKSTEKKNEVRKYLKNRTIFWTICSRWQYSTPPNFSYLELELEPCKR